MNGKLKRKWERNVVQEELQCLNWLEVLGFQWSISDCSGHKIQSWIDLCKLRALKYPLLDHMEVDWHRQRVGQVWRSLCVVETEETADCGKQSFSTSPQQRLNAQWAQSHGHTATWLGRSYFSLGQSHQRHAVFLDLQVRASHHTVSLCHFLFLCHIQEILLFLYWALSQH